MGRFFADLGHPDQISCGVELIKAGSFEIELIAQHEDKVAFGASFERISFLEWLQDRALPVVPSKIFLTSKITIVSLSRTNDDQGKRWQLKSALVILPSNC